MSFEASWSMSGTSINTASQAFTQSAEKAIKNLKNHEAELNKRFRQHLSDNIRRSGIEADNLSEVFLLRINGNDINFVNIEPLVTQRYEYGYYNGSKDTNEEYYEEYMIQTSPAYFIRPSIQQSLNDIGQLIINDAKKEYTKMI